MLPGLGLGPGGGPVTYGYGPIGIIGQIFNFIANICRTPIVALERRIIKIGKDS